MHEGNASARDFYSHVGFVESCKTSGGAVLVRCAGAARSPGRGVAASVSARGAPPVGVHIMHMRFV